MKATTKINPDKMIREMVRKAYPDYKGRKFRLEVQERPLNCASYWDGGSRDYFTFMRLADMELQSVPQQSAYDREIRGVESVTLPEGIVCIELRYR